MKFSGNYAWFAACGLAACSIEPQPVTHDPYSPRYQHPYRHGAVATRETIGRMRSWEHWAHPPSAYYNDDEVSYGGGFDSIGVTSGVPRVYLVFYGSQWASGAGGDPLGVSTFLQALFTGIGTAGETWSGTVTQYCDGPTLRAGASSCNTTNTPHVGYPSQGALAGAWFDTNVMAPDSATLEQLSQEAVNAAAYFGNTTPEANRYAQYFIVSPSGTHPDGFGTGKESFCGWHNYTGSPYGDIAYSNLPYVSDAGKSCGVNFVNKGPQGVLDAFSIVAGHEYAETLTDQLPQGGWTNSTSGEEVAGECAWIGPGQGAAANVSMASGTFAMPGIWSNDTGQCEIAHPIR